RPDDDAKEPPEEAASSAMPAGEVACRRRLRATGAVFTEHEALADESGCSAPWPLSVSRLPGDVELWPDAVLTCAMAEATAGFVTTHAQPLARRELGQEIAAIDQVSAYVCRPR